MRILLLVTDIFGRTPHVSTLARDIGAAARICSPYAGAQPTFRNEAEAYAAFTAQTSIAAYAETVVQELKRNPTALAVGFSVGATALWLALGREAAPERRSVLYYGSRIREHKNLRQAAAVQLVFAESEKSFDPVGLTTELCSQGINAKVLPGTAHGFMNPLSPGYNAAAYAAQCARLRQLLGSCPG